MKNVIYDRYVLLDVFRGLAILWIVCFHLLDNVRENYGFILSHIINYGYLGVPIFFVISGYGISKSISDRALYFDKSHLFLLPRLKRIYFCYWWHLLFVVLIIPFFSALVSMLKTSTFNISLVKYSAVEWLKIITLVKVFSAVSWRLNLAFLPINGVVWYIAIIVQIYIFVYICLCFERRSYALLFFGFIASLLTYIPKVKALLPCGLFVPYFAEFYIGFVVYLLLKADMVPKKALTKITTLLFLTIILLYCFLIVVYFLSLSFAIMTGFVCLVMYKYDSAFNRLFISRLFYFVGTFSYSLYLLHVPLSRFVEMFVRNLGCMSQAISYPFILVPTVIILSYFWYLFFEKPSTQRKVIECILSPIDTLVAGFRIFKGIAAGKNNE